MNKKLRILFMGTPEFSVPMLDAIQNSEHSLVGVVTAPDKPAGRGRKISKSAVKIYAEKAQIPVYQPTNLKSDEFYESLQKLDPNVIVVIAFRMLPKQVWSYPEFGTFNLHASLLPEYRGAAPINWAIINGETETGLTTFFIDEKIDTGEIIDSTSIPITITDNLEDVYNKMIPKGVELVLKTLHGISIQSIQTKAQDKTNHGLKDAPKLTKANTKIHWNTNAEEIYNLVRGLSPYPLAWTVFRNNGEDIHCKVSKVSFSIAKHDYEFGKVIQKDKSLFVAVKGGFVELLELKLSGKRLMDLKTLLNGLTIHDDSVML
jgi:methionyl-tRNA formyltransferase